MIAIGENRGLWKGRLALSKGGAKPSCLFLTVVSGAIAWHFLACFLQETRSMNELGPLQAAGHRDLRLQEVCKVSRSRVPAQLYYSYCGRLAQGRYIGQDSR